MTQLKSNFNIKNKKEELFNNYKNLLKEFDDLIKKINIGGGIASIQKQHNKGKMTARERIEFLIDKNSVFFELGKFAAFEMYSDYGKIHSAGVIIGIAKINNNDCMIVANDATVKAGAYFEVTLKKTLRAQEIAMSNNLPIIYLVDSAGVFLPLQDQVFPDEGHFGKIFYNNARISSMGIHQIASVMGPCVAGGAYLPVMCDKYIITEGSNMFLAAPALVKAAIGQEIDAETLGGATTHSTISGTADYHEKNDNDALNRIKRIIKHVNIKKSNLFDRHKYDELNNSIEDLFSYINFIETDQYEMKEIILRVIDNNNFEEYKENYGQTIICGHCRIGGFNVGIVANQKRIVKTNNSKIQLGGVIYNESSDKAARFIMNCNQDKIPIIFIHDVNGFMVGKDSEWAGIAKDGAKMVNAVSNSTVPKISLVVGGSYGAGNYAMSGRAFNSSFIYAWPSAKIAVMGGEQAANTLISIKLSKVGKISDIEKENIKNDIRRNYEKQSNIKYAAARMWIDEIIHPKDTRFVLIRSLEILNNQNKIKKPNFGVFQV